MKRISVISLVIALIAICTVNFSVEATIDLAPVAEGTSGKQFLYTFYHTASSGGSATSTTIDVYSDINGVSNFTAHNTTQSTTANLGPFIRAGKFQSTTSTSTTSYTSSTTYTSTTVRLTQTNIKGIIEFDISSLSTLTGPFSATLRLDYNGKNFNTVFPKTLSLFDMGESAEDGVVTAGEVKGAKITDIFTLPAGSGGPSAGFYYYNVTSALLADLANIGTNSYSGFMIDFDGFDSPFPFDPYFDVTSEVTFNNYDFSGGEGPKLIINTSPVPEPASLILLGSGLIGIYFFRRKFK